MTRPLLALGLAAALGCGGAVPPAPPAGADLPPAYTRALITDPAVEAVARGFSEWAVAQKAGGAGLYSRVEVLPPVPTLLPYGVGTFQKESRLPAIVTTGPGWDGLPPAGREAAAARAFDELAARLAALKTAPPLRPTLTIQTPQGVELAWVNDRPAGRALLHGDGE
jgi:hypothetical protein